MIVGVGVCILITLTILAALTIGILALTFGY